MQFTELKAKIAMSTEKEMIQPSTSAIPPGAGFQTSITGRPSNGEKAAVDWQASIRGNRRALLLSSYLLQIGLLTA